jgi:hypothetical protein
MNRTPPSPPGPAGEGKFRMQYTIGSLARRPAAIAKHPGGGPCRHFRHPLAAQDRTPFRLRARHPAGPENG